MRARFVIGAAGIGGLMLVLAVMCVVVAQGPARTRGGTIAQPGRTPPPATRFVVPASQPAIIPSETPTLSAPPISFPATDLAPGSLTPSPSTRPAAIELRSGLKLEGQLAVGPIPCLVMFGEASLPLETIRGIRMSDEVATDEAGQPRATGATIILENGDSLTGLPRVEVIRLQTDWGEAIVKLAHLKSLVLTSESVMWQEQEGRWRLVPVLPATDAAEDNGLAPRSQPAPLDATEAPPTIVPRASQPAPPADDSRASPPIAPPVLEAPKG